MGIGFNIRRIEQIVSNALSFTGTASQINGLIYPAGASATDVLTPATLAGFTYGPQLQQQGIFVANTSATAILYIGTSNTITAGNGGGWIWQIDPGGTEELDCNSCCTLWAIGSGSGTMTVAPFQ